MLEGALPGGQLTTTSEVENFPGFPGGVDGYQLMDNLRKQAEKFGARFEQALVSSVDFAGMPREAGLRRARRSWPGASSSPRARRRA